MSNATKISRRMNLIPPELQPGLFTDRNLIALAIAAFVAAMIPRGGRT
jgi:hypothetical protein